MKKLNSSICVLIVCCLLGQISPAQNVITDWAGIVQPAINNSNSPRPPASSEVLHATIQLAVYNAAIAIEGGFQPYGSPISAPHGADVRAAVATAAYRTARARVDPSQDAYLDSQYQSYLAGISAGKAKTEGIQAGEDAAAALLLLRANDGFSNIVPYECSDPLPVGEFEPNGGCGTQPVDAKLAKSPRSPWLIPAASDPAVPIP